jgi:hypothetical protein
LPPEIKFKLYEGQSREIGGPNQLLVLGGIQRVLVLSDLFRRATNCKKEIELILDEKGRPDIKPGEYAD